MSECCLKRLTEAQIQALEAQHPLGLGMPGRVAGPERFLFTGDALWITGTALTMDGGVLSQ